LTEWVEQDPRTAGQPFSVWTCLELAKQLLAQMQVQVSPEAVRKHLHRLQYHLIRPVLSVSSPDPDYQIKVQRLADCQQQAGDGKLILLYEDEFDLNLLPGVIRCWTKQGSQRKIPTPGQNIKRYGFGAVNSQTGQVLYRVGEHKDSAGFCELLEQIVPAYCPGETYSGPKVAVVVDNYRIHSSKLTQATLDKYADRLFVVPLPTYSPKLNVIELLWKYLRRKVTHNHLFENIEKLIQAVEAFLKSLDQHRDTVLSVIGYPG
jgi:hypothetical protein